MKRPLYQYLPPPMALLFGILVVAALLTAILPAGVYDRADVGGQMRVVPGTYHAVDAQPVGVFGLFKALPKGFSTASPVIFVVLISGIMFGIMEKTGAIEHGVGSLVRWFGTERRKLLVVLLTYVFGLFGVAVGYENNIALIPIAAVVSLAIGGDLMLAAGFSVAAITVGFGLSPINAYTIGVGHKIAELPLFSGAGLRSVLCFAALSVTAWYNLRYYKRLLSNPANSLSAGIDTAGFQLSQALHQYKLTGTHLLVLLVFVAGMGVMLYGTFNLHWHFTEISALFAMIAVGVGVVGRLSASTFSQAALQAVSVVAPGAFMVGLATSVKEVLEMGQINDSISHYLSLGLQGLPTAVAAVGMSVVQSAINLFIPSGSGQALATLPIMIPLGEVLGLSRQSCILAFQIGDGVTNLFNPMLGGLIAMLGMCRIPFDRWLRFAVPLMLMILLLAWLALVIGVLVGY